ncbi:hypothetical protein JZ785_01500 [Alicyclobacillus curvatus]|nr:hypothetical protein JZ785_01500 [Alicyclobacillus curvatus]
MAERDAHHRGQAIQSATYQPDRQHNLRKYRQTRMSTGDIRREMREHLRVIY